MSLTEQAFGELMRVYGRERPDFLRFEEGPPTLPTRFAADEAVSAVHAAGAVVAADLWTLRSGERQRVEVSTREAGVSLTNFRYVRFDDPARQAEREAWGKAALTGRRILGFHPTKDGRHVILHPSFPPGA